MEMSIRPRCLRGSEVLRKMVRETRMDKSSLIFPIFVKEGTNIKEEIHTMPGQYRYSVDTLPKALEELLDAGVNKVMFSAYRIRKMRWEARHMHRMELCRKLWKKLGLN